MLAALFLGFVCVGCSDKSEDEQGKPSEAQYDHVEVKLTFTASEGAREMFTFSGVMMGFANTEVVDAASIEAINYAASNDITFNMTEDAPAQATLRITAAKKSGFEPSDQTTDVEFSVKIEATAYDTDGKVLSTASDMISSSYKGAECSDGFRDIFVSTYPKNRVITLVKGSDGYKLEAAGMAH